MQSDNSDDNISEAADNISDEQEDDEVSFHSQSSQGRGRPRIPESWTRVISFKNDNLENQYCFPIGTDLILAQNLPRHIDLK